MRKLLHFQIDGPWDKSLRDSGRTTDSIGDVRDQLLLELDTEETFLSLPERHAKDYAHNRDTSTLGQIFSLANGIQNDIDAVVVLARKEWTLPLKALLGACCNPFHNELSRGHRGSKPRFYIVNPDFDNDTLATLRSHLRDNGRGDMKAERSWALVTVAVPFDAQLEAYRRLLRPQDASHDLSVTMLADENIKSNFYYPRHTPAMGSLLTASCLLPAAMLGLDCIKLVEGAYAMNLHFRDSPCEENSVLQFAALSITAKSTLTAWDHSLERIADWTQAIINDGEVNELQFRLVGRDLLTRYDSAVTDLTVTHHLVPETTRMDAIPTEDHESLPMLLRQDFSKHYQSRISDGQTMTQIRLPEIDTYYLGQYFQMMMLASQIHRRLLQT